MKKIQGEMQQRKEFLRQVIREKEQSLKSAPEGILNISANDKRTQYYYKDERVRSKSEILIANALTKHNIPYRYEAPIYLNGYGTVYPDFTILNIRLRKELFWEHLGMMDDASYVEKALEKIDTYQKNNIFPGEKLILTHESAYRPLNTRIIDRMIECYCI